MVKIEHHLKKKFYNFYVIPLELGSFIVIFVASGEATNAPMFGRLWSNIRVSGIAEKEI